MLAFTYLLCQTEIGKRLLGITTGCVHHLEHSNAADEVESFIPNVSRIRWNGLIIPTHWSSYSPSIQQPESSETIEKDDTFVTRKEIAGFHIKSKQMHCC